MKNSSIIFTATGFVLSAMAYFGCSASGASSNPVPVPASDAGGKDVTVTPDAPSVDAAVDREAGPVVRTVSVRDPWGELDPTNMMHDGDFEFSGLNTAQYPWLGIEQTMIRTGAECRGGLRCLLLKPSNFVIGIFVWPDAPYAEVSFYGAITTGTCETEGTGLLVKPQDETADPIRVLPTTPQPVGGWCHYGMTIEVDPSHEWWSLWLAARTKATGTVLFDSVSIRGTATPPAPGQRSAQNLPEDVRRLFVESRKKLLPAKPPREPKPVNNPTGRARN